jgi:hypothetical protein
MSEETMLEEVEYEGRLRCRLKILQEKFEAGKVKIVEGLDVEKSLLADQGVRVLDLRSFF